MSIKAMKQALEALEYTTNLSRFLLNDEANIGPMLKADEAITSLHQAIAEAEKQEQSAEHVGEPVGEMQLSAIYEGMVVPVVPVELPAGTKLYTTPQQRTWVGLTDEDKLDAKIKGCSLDDYIEIVEAKLRSKNI
jgi:hypothetical protein